MSGREKLPLPFCSNGAVLSPRELLLSVRGALFRGMGLMFVILDVSSPSSTPPSPCSSCWAKVLNSVCTPFNCFLLDSSFLLKCLDTRSAFVASSHPFKTRMQTKSSACLLIRPCTLQALTSCLSLKKPSLESAPSSALLISRVLRSSSICCTQALIAVWSRPSLLHAPRRSKTLRAPCLWLARCSWTSCCTFRTSPSSSLSFLASSTACVQAMIAPWRAPETESAHIRETTLVTFALRASCASRSLAWTSFSSSAVVPSLRASSACWAHSLKHWPSIWEPASLAWRASVAWTLASWRSFSFHSLSSASAISSSNFFRMSFCALAFSSAPCQVANEVWSTAWFWPAAKPMRQALDFWFFR
mmetsp:Transcript_99326/g.289864  ORF Transcript_99326/g.289864 Transcript_99326/m.289864 type:complete len:360 (-) Transcript_99326:727-1806(-)